MIGRGRDALAAASLHLGAALPAWIAARLVVLVSVVAAHALFDHVEPPQPAVARHLREGVLGWDAQWYVDIATVGYDDLPPVGLRFFPLLPAVVRPLGLLLGGRIDVALLLVANLSALALGALVHLLCLRETGDDRLAARATWFVALVPPAFVLVWGYSEALWVSLAVATFLALRARRWWPAAGLAVLAGLVRPVGVLLAAPAAIEALRGGLRRTSWTERAARAAAVAGAPAGCALYLAWVAARFGDALLPFTVQQRPDYRGGFANPLAVAWRAGQQLVDGDLERNSLALHLPWLLVGVVLVAIAFRCWPASYGAFAATALVVATSADRLGSFERYLFSSFPVVLALASVSARPSVERALLALGAAAMALYGTLALLGAYVP